MNQSWQKIKNIFLQLNKKDNYFPGKDCLKCIGKEISKYLLSLRNIFYGQIIHNSYTIAILFFMLKQSLIYVK